MKVRKNITLDDVVIQRVQSYAEQNGISFSSAIAVLAISSLDAANADVKEKRS